MSFNQAQPFTDEYKEQCFNAWVLAGCPPMSQTQGVLPDDPTGRRPNVATISRWMTEYNWRIRAEEIQTEALARVHDQLVDTKAQLLKSQFENAKALRQKALDQLLADGFDNSNAAVQAYFKSAQEERILLGVAEFAERVGVMTNEQLKEAIKEEIERFGVVDAIPVEEETDVVEQPKQDEHSSSDV